MNKTIPKIRSQSLLGAKQTIPNQLSKLTILQDMGQILRCIAGLKLESTTAAQQGEIPLDPIHGVKAPCYACQ